MKEQFDLSDEFDNNHPDHFTHYDYLLQVIENGQMSAFKEHLESITNNGLLTFLPLAGELRFTRAVEAEILKRMK